MVQKKSPKNRITCFLHGPFLSIEEAIAAPRQVSQKAAPLPVSPAEKPGFPNRKGNRHQCLQTETATTTQRGNWLLVGSECVLFSSSPCSVRALFRSQTGRTDFCCWFLVAEDLRVVSGFLVQRTVEVFLVGKDSLGD